MNPLAEIVLPVFGIVALGFFLNRNEVFDQKMGDALVRFTYHIAIPAMLFKNVATNPLPSQIPWNFLFAYYGPTLILFAVGYLFARYLFRWKRDESGVAAMSSSYSNLMLLGFPLALTAFGEDASLAVLVLLSSQSIILFPLTLTIFDFGLEDYSSTATQRRRIGRLILNPIVFSLALGLLFNGLEIQLQTPVLKTLDLLGEAGPGCALFALGLLLGQFEFESDVREVGLLVGLKNFVHPFLVWLGCKYFGVEGTWAYVAVLFAAMPTGGNAFIFSSQYDLKPLAASKTILISTLVSLVLIGILLVAFTKSIVL